MFSSSPSTARLNSSDRFGLGEYLLARASSLRVYLTGILGVDNSDNSDEYIVLSNISDSSAPANVRVLKKALLPGHQIEQYAAGHFESLKGRLAQALELKRMEAYPDFKGMEEWNERYLDASARFFLGEKMISESASPEIKGYDEEAGLVKIRYIFNGYPQVAYVPLKDVHPKNKYLPSC